MERARVIVTSKTFYQEPKAFAVLEDGGCEVVRLEEAVLDSLDEVRAAGMMKGVAGAVMSGQFPIGERFFARAKALRAVSLNAAGYNQVDLDAARRHGVRVCNVPGLGNAAVADFMMGQILVLMRRIAEGDKTLRAGRWNAGVRRSAAVAGSTLGIVGLGAIGQGLARRAKGFGMPVVACVRRPDAQREKALGVRFVPLEALFAQADVVALCCPLNEETQGMVSAGLLARMKPTAFLVNAARGAVVDEAALLAALQAEAIAGAALDVFGVEPLRQSPFFALDNVLLSPHMGGLADRQLRDVAVAAAENLVALLQGGQVGSLLA